MRISRTSEIYPSCLNNFVWDVDYDDTGKSGGYFIFLQIYDLGVDSYINSKAWMRLVGENISGV